MQPAAAAVTAVNVATPDFEATSRKRILVADDFEDSNNKRPCLETATPTTTAATAPEKNFDEAIAEIVAVIDEESKMLGNRKYLFRLLVYNQITVGI